MKVTEGGEGGDGQRLVAKEILQLGDPSAWIRMLHLAMSWNREMVPFGKMACLTPHQRGRAIKKLPKNNTHVAKLWPTYTPEKKKHAPTSAEERISSHPRIDFREC